MAKEVILGLDLATNVGVAWGPADGKPFAATWNIGGTVSILSPEEKGVKLLRHLLDFLSMQKIDRVYIEKPMTPVVMAQIGTTPETALFLIGIAYLVLVTCKSRGIRAELVDSQKVRKHFIGQATSGKGRDKSGKTKTQDKCRLLGWSFQNPDEADALAVWSFGVGQTNPAIAHIVDPLFAYGMKPAPAPAPKFGAPKSPPKAPPPAVPTVESVFGRGPDARKRLEDVKPGDVISLRDRGHGSGKA
ncbi:hypothetical protein [Microvirga sp. Mcv34]|uniref:hypothetical protein n=1 Tax=Microvirga sp. Mcv34 TaxID=2926016 RepID=UPI0021C6FD40|nr:hypothetical protein [Microvirga sp. Mcv34]